ncbi:uncharacterized protein LOC119113902 [Pollicipes pollicipes]|uniref:uncharacterized protein LOC119113902 n=1 Tax=Pollicipes pollicipes TaxID=41117 RepID=UPI00188551F8|nr:uncharacterized protein LOC119113902 [Pollicipes pollicipes]
MEKGSGAEPWSVSQLSDMAAEEVKECQAQLGSVMADEDKLKVVWDELKEAYSGADKVPMSMIGYVGSVIPSADIAMLDLTTEDAVFELGMPMKMTEAQLDALATRAKAQWSVLSGSAADYTADTVGTLGQIICGMAPADVESIPAARFKEAMTVLSEVYWCKQAVAEKLADKAVAIYGEPSTWGMSEVAGVGAVIGGLEAMKLKSIKDESMRGLSADGMMSIPPSKIAGLTKAQVLELSTEAALAISDEQMEKLPDDAKEALLMVFEENLKSRSARSAAAGLSLLLLGVFAARLA